ncbi:DASS family sodium-coupled anion symporter [Candidatus Woesearchaeota archaeon]|nr:DASS family sodium-coupled anion symporter [Candidatus Woesearchaeota archaeon]MBW3018123.1 DASS family sodium-coupled anion symporter [Candidatus Woesearchaeota archaeon]
MNEYIKKLLLVLPAIILVVLFLIIPAPERLGFPGWITLLIFLIVIYFWVIEIVPLAITALLGIALLLATGTVSFTEALSGFSSSGFFLILVGFGIAIGLMVTGLDKRIACKILNHCTTERSIIFWTILVTAGFSMIMSNTTTVILMIPILRHLVERAKVNRIALFLAVAFAANIGGVGTVIGSPPNVIAAQALNLHFIDWFVIGFPIALIMLALLFLSFLLYFKLQKKKIKIKIERLKSMTRKEKLVSFFLILTIIGWFTSPLHGLSTVAVGLMGTVLMLAFVYSWKDFQQNTDWSVVILIGGAISLGTALQITGVAQWLAENVISLTGIEHPLLIIFALVVFSIALTQFIQNTATAAMMVPVLVALSSVYSTEINAFVFPVIIGVSMTFLLPPGTAPNALVHSETKIRTIDMIKAGLLPTAFAFACLFVLSWIML